MRAVIVFEGQVVEQVAELPVGLLVPAVSEEVFVVVEQALVPERLWLHVLLMLLVLQ